MMCHHCHKSMRPRTSRINDSVRYYWVCEDCMGETTSVISSASNPFASEQSEKMSRYYLLEDKKNRIYLQHGSYPGLLANISRNGSPEIAFQGFIDAWATTEGRTLYANRRPT